MILIEFLLGIVFLAAVGVFVFVKVSGWVKVPDPISKLKDASNDLDNLEDTQKARAKEIEDLDKVKNLFFEKVNKVTTRKSRQKNVN